MAYASTADLYARFDRRVIAQLSNDTNGGAAVTANVEAALEDATSDILEAALQGSIYTEADMNTLEAANDNTLIRLCCDLAARHIANRRMQGVPAELESRIEKSLEFLEKLRIGSRVLNVARNRDADVPDYTNDEPDDFPRANRMTDTSFFTGISDD